MLKPNNQTGAMEFGGKGAIAHPLAMLTLVIPLL